MIPKIIHYIWFGPNPYPEKVRQCIASWHKHLPDYELRLWNEESFPIDNACDFVREAYAMKKYAFVSDYVRLWALREFGGVYLDTDIEVLKPFTDEILNQRVVLGTDDSGYLTALMMSEPGHPYFANAMEAYHSMSFVMSDGKLNMEVNNTSLQQQLSSYGYHVDNTLQQLDAGIVVYPDDFFHVRSLTTGKLHLTSNSFAIHWHTITWVPVKTRIINFLRINVLVPIVGSTLYTRISKRIKNGKTSI